MNRAALPVAACRAWGPLAKALRYEWDSIQKVAMRRATMCGALAPQEQAARMFGMFDTMYSFGQAKKRTKIGSGLTGNRLFQGRDRYQSTHPNRFADLGHEHLGMGCVLPPDMLEDSLQLSSTDDLLCSCPLPPTSDTPASPAVDQASPTDVASLLNMSLTEAKRRAASDFERRYLVRVMDLARGSVSEGARRSGLDRTNFRRLLQRHGLR